MFAAYKQFERYFFRENKAENMIAYVKLKHQFRSLLCLSLAALVPTIYVLIMHGMLLAQTSLLFLVVVVGFRLKAYKTVIFLFFMLMMIAPGKYTSNSLVFFAPCAIYMTAIQILAQTQSEKLVALHLAIQAIGFYFYGMDRMVATIRGMTIEEVVESARTTVLITFGMSVATIACMRIFYSHFSSLLKKISILKESISKANKQLNDQNLKLQTNLELKDVFIYTFSHELKNALNGLLGNLYLAAESAKVSRSIEFLSSAKICGEILKNFIHNILDSGKLENGNLEVSPERKDVMSFMQNVWTICGRIIGNKRLKGSLEIEKNVPRFLDLDEQRMIQIILNLVSNAVKFTEKGHVRIHVSWQTVSASSLEKEGEIKPIRIIDQGDKEEVVRETTRLGDIREFPDTLEARPSKKESHHLVTEYQKKFIEGSQFYELNLVKSQWNPGEVLSSALPEGSKGTLKIQVLDSGCGISIENQAKLFQKFSQVSQAADQRKIGTGLGLWICKELANQLNGDIKIRSIVGVGSVFELAIRTRVSHIPEKFRSVSPSMAIGCNSPTRCSFELGEAKKSKVLIADDDSFNMELMKNYLNKFSINYLCAYDGEEAVSLFKKHCEEICFVITDNFMPKKLGTEAAFEISSFLEDKKLPKIPILCVSGDLKVTVGERGITSVIQKPINFERLKQELMIAYPHLTQQTSGRDTCV